MREPQHPRVNRKSSLVLEAVSLESTSREDAGPRGQKKELPILVLHHTAGRSRGPSISGGPEQNTTGSRPHWKYQAPSNRGRELQTRHGSNHNCGHQHRFRGD
jgi:hypothetical protein